MKNRLPIKEEVPYFNIGTKLPSLVSQDEDVELEIKQLEDMHYAQI